MKEKNTVVLEISELQNQKLKLMAFLLRLIVGIIKQQNSALFFNYLCFLSGTGTQVTKKKLTANAEKVQLFLFATINLRKM